MFQYITGIIVKVAEKVVGIKTESGKYIEVPVWQFHACGIGVDGC
jgi:hypothetical protein